MCSQGRAGGCQVVALLCGMCVVCVAAASCVALGPCVCGCVGCCPCRPRPSQQRWVYCLAAGGRCPVAGTWLQHTLWCSSSSNVDPLSEVLRGFTGGRRRGGREVHAGALADVLRPCPLLPSMHAFTAHEPKLEVGTGTSSSQGREQQTSPSMLSRSTGHHTGVLCLPYI
jgi:hypothetical protein